MKNNDLLDDKEPNDEGKKTSYKEIIDWWESRRLEYNLIILIAEIFILFGSFGMFVLSFFKFWQLPFLYFLIFNVLFTFTWIFELLLNSIFKSPLEEGLKKILYVFLILFSVILPIINI